jgi:transposase InsO family protein
VDKKIAFAVIKRFSEKYHVRDMCRFYGVSRSGYYAWTHREPVSAKDRELIKFIEECHVQNKRRYGYRRVALWLRREKGMMVNHKKVLRITQRYNLLSVIRRRRLYKYVPNGNLRYVNILNRNFFAEHPNQRWVTDISYIITEGGILYLSAIRDLYDNYIVAHKVAKRQNYSLVEQTIKAALAAETPKGKVLLHTDQGGQYCSYDHKALLEENNIMPSMSAPGSPGDNAMAENFFSIFKTECIYLEKPKTPEEAEMMTREFVDYYNYQRIQTRKGLTPYELRRNWFDSHLNG